MKAPAVNFSRSLLYNRFVLYFVVLVAVVNLYSLVYSGNSMYAAMFILVGFLTSFFSKNMTVILVVAVAITNLVKSGTASNGGLEGFREGATDKESMKSSEDLVGESLKDDSSEKPLEVKPSEKKKPDKKEVDKIKKEIINDGKELLKLQKNIVGGFQEIQPYMTQAEKLATKITDSAATIESMKNGSSK